MAPATETASNANAWKPRSTLVGALLVNRYRISQLIGQGSTGAVYRADDVLSNRPVAVRVLTPHVAQLELISRVRARIERNAEIKRKSPDALINLVDTLDVGITIEGETFVVTDYLEGDHLASMLTRGGRLPWSRARSLLVRLCQLLHGFHQQGVVLGTLQARHCYAVRGRPKSEAIKITSTVILEQVSANLGPGSGAAGVAMARYIAPEQACGEPTDPRTDVYSLGVIAYELLTGRLPFDDANAIRLVSMHLQAAPPPLRQVAPDAQIPAAVEQVILKALAKAPADRHSSMDALAAALSAVPEQESGFSAAPYPGAAPLPAVPLAPPAFPNTLLASPVPPVAAPPVSPAIPVPAPIPPPAALLAPPPVSPAIPAPTPPPAALLAPPPVSPASPAPLPPPAALLAPPPVSPASPIPPPPVDVTAAPPVSPGGPIPAPLPPPAPVTAAPPVSPAIPAPLPASPIAAPVPPPPAAPTASPALPGDPLDGVVMPPLRAPTGPLIAPPRSGSSPIAAKISPSVVMRPLDPAAPAAPTAAPAPPAITPPKRPPSVPLPSAVIPPLRKATAAPPAETADKPAATAPKPVEAVASTLAVAPDPAPTRRPTEPRPEVSPASLRAAALRASEPAPVSVVSESPSESIIAELPRRRVSWVAVIGLGGAIAAGAAAYIQTQSEDPPATGARANTPPPPNPVVKDPRTISPPTATTIAATTVAAAPDPAPEPVPERGSAVVPDAPVPSDPPDPSPPTEAVPTEPAVPSNTPPDKPDPKVTDKGEKKKKKRTARKDVEPEEEEEDVFDQLRKHMEAQKAAEEQRKANMAKSPAPAPAPAKSEDATRAKDTLDRARQASSQGNHTLAYSLAKQSFSLAKNLDALELMGVSACKAGNEDNARSAVNQLAGTRRSAVVDVCAKNGITL